MAIRIFELEDRVFEVKVVPDTPGRQKRRLTIKKLSGKPMSDEDWLRIGADCLKAMRETGWEIDNVEYRP